MLFEPVLIVGVDLVAMAVPFGDFGGTAIDLRHPAAAPERRRVSAEPHGAAEIAVLAALLQLVAAEPFRHQADHRLRRRTELGRIGVLDADEIARSLDHGHLHAEADAEIRHVALPGELRRPDLALRAALPEAAGHQDAIH